MPGEEKRSHPGDKYYAYPVVDSTIVKQTNLALVLDWAVWIIPTYTT